MEEQFTAFVRCATPGNLNCEQIKNKTQQILSFNNTI